MIQESFLIINSSTLLLAFVSFVLKLTTKRSRVLNIHRNNTQVVLQVITTQPLVQPVLFLSLYRGPLGKRGTDSLAIISPCRAHYRNQGLHRKYDVTLITLRLGITSRLGLK